MGAGMKGEADVGFFNVLTGLLTLMLAGILSGLLAGFPAGMRALAPARRARRMSAPIPHASRLPVRLARRVPRHANSRVADGRVADGPVDACRPAGGAVRDANPAQGPPPAPVMALPC